MKITIEHDGETITREFKAILLSGIRIEGDQCISEGIGKGSATKWEGLNLIKCATGSVAEYTGQMLAWGEKNETQNP